MPLFGQKNIWLRTEGGVKLKTSLLSINELNAQLKSQGFLPIDEETEEVEFFFIASFYKLPFSVVFSSSSGGSETRNQASFTRLRTNYLSIGILKDLTYHRFSLRPSIVYQPVALSGEVYNASQGISSLYTLSGSKIQYYSSGIRSGLQLLVNLGASRRLSMGAEWCYYYWLSEQPWQFYPTGVNTDLPAPENGQHSFGLVFMYRFYDQ